MMPSTHRNGIAESSGSFSMLPVHFREVLHLRYIEGLEYEVIAQELNLPQGTVKTWIHRAKASFLKEAEASDLSM